MTTSQDYTDNGQRANWEDAEEVPPETEDGAQYSAHGSYDSLFEAPDFADFIKRTKTAGAKEYEAKTAAFLKNLMIGALNIGDFPDAATIIKHGPGFAAATGFLAEEDEWAKKAIDFICSPGNPRVEFLMATLPFVAQLLRNRQPPPGMSKPTREERKQRRQQAKAQAQATMTPFSIQIPLFKKKFHIRIPFRLKAAAFWTAVESRTENPAKLTKTVFQNEKVQAALKKQGITVTVQRHG